MSPAAVMLAPLLIAGCSGADTFALGGHQYDRARLTQWALPRELREVSGLALDEAERLFAHDDEAAVVYQLDYRSGRVVKRFALGDPPRPGDYEGIAWADGKVYLVTSRGELLVGAEAGDGAKVDFELHRTGLGRRCEIEGLDHDPARNLLLMACKAPRQKALEGAVSVLAWSLERQAPAPQHDLVVPWQGQTDGSSLNPSALTGAHGNGNLILLAARQQAVIELGRDGTLLQVVALLSEWDHPQMEGIAVTASGDLLVADEADGRRGRLSVYAAAR